MLTQSVKHQSMKMTSKGFQSPALALKMSGQWNVCRKLFLGHSITLVVELMEILRKMEEL